LFSAISCHFLCLRYTRSSQRRVIKYIQDNFNFM